MVAYPPGSDYFSSALRFVLNAYSYAFFSLLFLSFFSVSIVSGLLACVCCACHVQYNGMALHSPCCSTTSNLLCSSFVAAELVRISRMKSRHGHSVMFVLHFSPSIKYTHRHPAYPVAVLRKKTKIHAGVHI